MQARQIAFIKQPDLRMLIEKRIKKRGTGAPHTQNKKRRFGGVEHVGAAVEAFCHALMKPALAMALRLVTVPGKRCSSSGRLRFEKRHSPALRRNDEAYNGTSSRGSEPRDGRQDVGPL